MTNNSEVTKEQVEKGAQIQTHTLPNHFMATGWNICSSSSIATAAKTNKCSDLKIAWLIRWMGYDFLIESLQLEEKVFNLVFSTQSPSFSERQHLLGQVQSHIVECVDCQFLRMQEKEEDELIDADIRYIREWL